MHSDPSAVRTLADPFVVGRKLVEAWSGRNWATALASGLTGGLLSSDVRRYDSSAGDNDGMLVFYFLLGGCAYLCVGAGDVKSMIFEHACRCWEEERKISAGKEFNLTLYGQHLEIKIVDLQ